MQGSKAKGPTCYRDCSASGISRPPTVYERTGERYAERGRQVFTVEYSVLSLECLLEGYFGRLRVAKASDSASEFSPGKALATLS